MDTTSPTRVAPRTRRAVSALAGAAMLALLAACGGGDATAAERPDRTTEAPETSARESTSTTTESTTTTTTEPTPTTVATSGPKPWANLRVGECVAAIPSGTFTSIELAPCDGPHAAEVFHRSFVFPDLARGISAEERAGTTCEQAYADHTGRPIDGSGHVISTLVAAPEPPTAAGSAPPLGGPNDSLVICLAEDASGAPLTGPIAGG